MQTAVEAVVCSARQGVPQGISCPMVLLNFNPDRTARSFFDLIMDKDKIAEKVREIVIEHLDILCDDYDPQLQFVDMGADSLDRLEMLLDAEKEFEIHIEDERAMPLKTPREAIDMIYNILTYESK